MLREIGYLDPSGVLDSVRLLPGGFKPSTASGITAALHPWVPQKVVEENPPTVLGFWV